MTEKMNEHEWKNQLLENVYFFIRLNFKEKTFIMIK